MENDYDDDTAGELDTHLLQNEWPATPVTQRIAELSEQAVTLHSTFRVSEATLLHEQLVARGFACRIDTTVALGTAYNVQVYAKDLAAAKEYVRGLRRAARMRLTLAH